MSLAQGACPDEANSPPGSPGLVLDNEAVIRVVPIMSQIERKTDGTLTLAVAAITREELSGRNNKSVSVLREPSTPATEVLRRALDKNRQVEWTTDPVLARANVGELRKLIDNAGWRTVCVNADPTSDQDDRLGACPTHAGIVRSHPQPAQTQRMEWMLVRAAVAEKFDRVEHCSGAPVVLP